LGIEGKDKLLEPTAFIVNQQQLEITELKTEKIQNDEDEEMFDFTKDLVKKTDVQKSIETNYIVKAAGTYRNLS